MRPDQAALEHRAPARRWPAPAAAAIRSSSPASLTSRSSSTSAAGRHQLDPVAHLLRQLARGCARSCGASSKPGAPVQLRGQVGEQVAARRAAARSRVHLLLGLLDVAEVGEEQAPVAGDHDAAPLVPVKPVR